MGKKPAKGPPRGPYRFRDVEDPNKLGTGGIRLRQHRLARAWTVRHLSELSGVPHGSISDIENSKGGYGPETLMKLAAALGTTVGALFDVDPREGTYREIWPLLNRAKPGQAQRIRDFAKGVLGEDD